MVSLRGEEKGRIQEGYGSRIVLLVCHRRGRDPDFNCKTSLVTVLAAFHQFQFQLRQRLLDECVGVRGSPQSA